MKVVVSRNRARRKITAVGAGRIIHHVAAWRGNVMTLFVIPLVYRADMARGTELRRHVTQSAR